MVNEFLNQVYIALRDLVVDLAELLLEEAESVRLSFLDERAKIFGEA